MLHVGLPFPPGTRLVLSALLHLVFVGSTLTNADDLGVTLHVAPHGSDDSPGTAWSPLRTLHAARDRLRKRDAARPNATVFIHAGTHDFSHSPLELDGERDGDVAWRAFPGEQPLLSGGVRVPLSDALPWPGRAGAMSIDLRRYGISEKDVGQMRLPDVTKDSGLYDCQHGVMDVFATELRQPMVLARWPNLKANGSWTWAPMGSGSGRCSLPGRPAPSSDAPIAWKPSPQGQRAADAYCEKQCFPAIKDRPCDGPTVARYGRSIGQDYAWRCYSPSQLEAATFGNCTKSSRLGCCLCTEDEGIRAALNASGDPAPPPPPPPPLCSELESVWFECPACGDRPQMWAKEGGGWWHGYAVSGYADQYVPIERIVPVEHEKNGSIAIWNLTLKKPPHDPGLREGNPFMVLNLLSELDTAGEVFFFPNATLVFIPFPEQDLKQDTLTVSMAPKIMHLQNLSHLTISGLRFAFARGTGLIAENVSHLLVENVTSELHGEDGIRVERSWNSTIGHSVVSNVGCVGIALSGGDPKTLRPGNLLLHDSHLSNFAQWKRTYRPGLEWAGVQNEYRSNLIENGPHACVLGGASESEMTELDHLRSVSCRFINNTFRHCAFECSDCGAWYSCGQAGNAFTNPNNTIEGNRFLDVQPAPHLFGANEGTEMSVHAVYLDDMLSFFTVKENVFTNCSNAVFVGGGRNTSIVDNQCRGCGTMIAVDSRGKQQQTRCANASGDTRRALAEMNVTIPGTPWNIAFPSLQLIAEDHPCLPVHVVVKGNRWCGSGRANWKFSIPSLNDSQWRDWLAVEGDNRPYATADAALYCPGRYGARDMHANKPSTLVRNVKQLTDDEVLPSSPVEIHRLGTVDLGILAEVTPVVFKGELQLFESIQTTYYGNMQANGSFGKTGYLRFVNVRSGQHSPSFGHGFQLGSAYVDGDTMHVFATFAPERISSNNTFVSHFWSTNLVHWEEAVVLDFTEIPNWRPGNASGDKMVWNTSVDKGKLNGKPVWVMAFEWSDPKVGWNTLFATAPSIYGPWSVDTKRMMSRDVSHANPTLRFFPDPRADENNGENNEDGYWYVWTNRDTCGSVSAKLDLSEIYRSRDLIKWEAPAGWSNETCTVHVLSPSQHEDVAVVPSGWHPDTRPTVAQHYTKPWTGKPSCDPVTGYFCTDGGLRNATDINNSDMDLCEYNNKTILYYSWGNQGLGVFAMALAVAEANVSNHEFARSFFGE